MSNKLMDLEDTAKGIFGGNFLCLSETCRALGKNLSQGELVNFRSISMDNKELEQQKGNGFILMPFLGVDMDEMYKRLPGLFSIRLTDSEMLVLKKTSITPGWYLVGEKPKHLSFGLMGMRAAGMPVQQNPKLIELMYVYYLFSLIRKRRMSLIAEICTLCREEVIRRGDKKQICFRKNSDTGIRIEAWTSEIPLPNVFPIKKI